MTKAAPRSLVRTLPDGTLKAAQSAAGGADKGGDALHIYVRGQLLPAREGAARPWVWAGPVRAWSADYERKVAVQGGGSRLEAGIWVCCKEGAFLLPVDRAARARPGFAESEAHARSWATGDGLLARLASDEERLPLTLQIRYAAKDGDGGIPVVGGDATLDTGLAAARKQVRAGSRVLPFADYLWMSAAPA